MSTAFSDDFLGLVVDKEVSGPTKIEIAYSVAIDRERSRVRRRSERRAR